MPQRGFGWRAGIALAALLAVVVHPAQGPDGVGWEETFRPVFTTTRGVALQALALQADGRVLVAGNFHYVGGEPRRSVARLNADGNPDPGFNVGAGVDGTVAALAVQPADGRILVGGRFRQVQGQPRTALARLEPDGRLDATFAPRLAGSPAPVVKAVLVQPDGRILLAGRFQEVEGRPRDGLARLMPDGSLDEAFDPGRGLNGGVAFDLALDAKDRVLVAGNFSVVDAWSSAGVARLFLDGRVDTSFAGNLQTGGADGGAYAVASALDDRVYVAGTFDMVDARPQARMVRLGPDGRLDETFAFREGVLGGLEAVFDVVTTADGAPVLAGSFEWVNDLEHAGLVRLQADGTPDAAFDPGPGLQAADDAYGYRLARQPDGAVIVAGKFTEAGGVPRHCVARFRPDGRLDESFAGPDLRFETAGEVLALAVAPDGAVLAAGGFERVNGQPRPGLARLLPDGQTDPVFRPDLPPEAQLYAVARDPAGRCLIAGEFDRVGDQPAQNLARLLPDGRPDPAFAPPQFNHAVRALALPPGGGILAGGAFTRVDPFRRLGLVRLLEDGSVDDGFDVRIESALGDPEVRALAVDAAGRVWVGGRFHLVNGEARPNLARLGPDGALDAEYAADLAWTGEAPAVNSLALTPDGRCMLGGTFFGLQGQPRPGLARLRPDGSLDTAFVPAVERRAGEDAGGVRHVVALPDHRVAVVGALAERQKAQPLALAVLDAQGRLLAGEASPPEAGLELAVLATGGADALLAGGHFELEGATSRAGLARYRLAPYHPEFRVHIALERDQVVVDWLGAGRLEQADSPAGPWREVTDTAPLRVTPEPGEQFFRLGR